MLMLTPSSSTQGELYFNIEAKKLTIDEVWKHHTYRHHDLEKTSDATSDFFGTTFWDKRRGNL